MAVLKCKMYDVQGGEGRQTKAENLRSSRAIQSIFSLLGRNGNFLFLLFESGFDDAMNMENENIQNSHHKVS